MLAKSEIESILTWVAAWRGAAAVPFIFIYAFAALVLLPDSLLTIAAGVIFGLVRGLVLVSIGSMLGATAAFFLGRSLARDWVHRRIDRWPKFRALDRAISRHGFWVVFLTRLSPIIPYGLLNYAYGLTTVRVRDYLLASWIGMLPASLLYVYAGTAAATLAEVISGRARMGQRGDILLWLGLVATIAVIGLLTYVARRELARELQS
jgi:uncharacterized membrane protein YdjX (TVP38/TMEM64 family)